MHSVYRIDASRRLVTLYWNEFPSIEQLKEVVQEAISDSEFKPGMNFLWDRKPGLANPASGEYLRDLEAKSDGTKVTIRAFRSAGDAEEWLRNPVPYEPFVVHLPARGASSMYPELGA